MHRTRPNMPPSHHFRKDVACSFTPTPESCADQTYWILKREMRRQAESVSDESVQEAGRRNLTSPSAPIFSLQVVK